MKTIKIFQLSVLTGLLLFASSCEKNFLDVNDNPNFPAKASPELILPSIQGYTAYTMGNQYHIIGGLWSQYYTQGALGSQYRDEDSYLYIASDANRPWNLMYAGSLTDCQSLIEQAQAEGLDNYTAIGKIMQGYIYQMLTDVHGDIPFSEALKGKSDANVSPKYDSQDAVYDGIISIVNEGLALIDEDATAITPHGDDLFYGGDMHLWRKFANTLKLKIYIRQSGVRPGVAQAGIAAMEAAGDEFVDYDEDAEMQFIDVLFNQNPLYTTMQATFEGNLVASATIIDTLLNRNDPRIDALYNPASTGTNNGAHVGIPQGDGPNLPSNPPALHTNYSTPIIEPTTPVIFISASESYFLQAEAAAKGYTSGDAEFLYLSGIDASMYRLGFGGIDSAQLNDAPLRFAADDMKAIAIEKWISMANGQNIEAWTEWRRTGYPAFNTTSTSVLPSGTFPGRLLYPSDELTRNANAPSQPLISSKVWWDVN